MAAFQFAEFPTFSDGVVDVAVERRVPGDPARGWVPAYHFRISPHGQSVRAGQVDLRIGDTDHLVRYGGHLGYGVEPEHRGRAFAARACQLIRPVALHHGMTVLWITCNPDNGPSRRTCERLGAALIEIVELPPDTDMYAKGERSKCRYRWALTPSS